ncbi:putative hydrolase of the HAD superfamily [Mangrovibacterium marinum]|uniref:Putative hydrolase of the HAD superfamily n=1 Tax=Mangrovibacterium marinum TaxID=1639118 RepID=A0A2T5C1C3_9BACT|nr:YjjG family noncanonical pyrimidine nucleotidase [Mangrovibacterium marinum]PTN08412.1 putative hydrolase of the HAD superfamily [Mangrovibacterium marinum]
MYYKQKYTHLFFDLDNTLWDFDRNAKLAMRDTVDQLKLNGQVPDFNLFYDFYEAVNKQLWDAYRKQEVHKKELITRRFAETLNHFEIKNVDPVAMNELYLDFMAQQTSLVEGAMDVLNDLKSNNYKLQIITNGFRQVQLRKLENSGIAHFFDHVFISEDLKYPKPDIRVFQHAIRSCNAKKAKSVMIGDNWETDILGARNFGIDQIFFSKDSKMPDNHPNNTPTPPKNDTFPAYTPHPNTYRIENLTNILRLL